MRRVTLEPHQLFRRLPLAPHQMRDRLTRIEDAIVLCHLGVPRIACEHWSLTIDGLVASTLTLTFADLARFAKFAVTSVHQCAGSPLRPREPRQRVCNLKWGGVRLADILSVCRPSRAAAYLWATGADFGAYEGVNVDAYVKDVPMARAMGDVLLAYEMNDAPLAPEHGYPARLVVPGSYGTNSVKWLTRLTLAATRAPGPFTTRWHNDPVHDAAAAARQQTAPVWSIAPQSVSSRRRTCRGPADADRGVGLGRGRGARPRRRCRRRGLAAGRTRSANREGVAALHSGVDAEAMWTRDARCARAWVARRQSAGVRPPQRGLPRPHHGEVKVGSARRFVPWPVCTLYVQRGAREPACPS